MVVSREIGFKAVHSHHGMLTEPSHGHDYVVRITMAGDVNEEGFICDFRAVKRLFKRMIVKQLDGRNLDEMFEYPTAENLSEWIWNQLNPFLPLHSIEVREKPHSSVVYSGPKKELNS
jgi:6-pyruvoyltetrahydropterin/6-carboxytetrahydropterin synthase